MTSCEEEPRYFNLSDQQDRETFSGYALVAGYAAARSVGLQPGMEVPVQDMVRIESEGYFKFLHDTPAEVSDTEEARMLWRDRFRRGFHTRVPEE